MDPSKNAPDASMPMKDYGSFCYNPVGDEDIESHHTDRWQQQAMYVGLHFPAGQQQGAKKRKHKRRGDKTRDSSNGKQKEPQKPAEEGNGKSATPPSQRVAYLLGNVDEDDPKLQSHDIFCEMDELRTKEDGEKEWKETARWIKFEEDVEEGGERWSKPHVATLSLHSLFELRKGIMSGTVMLDTEASNLIQITDLILDNMVASKQLKESNREAVQEVLLTRHRHQHEKHKGHHHEKKGLPFVRSLADIGRKHSEKTLEGKEGSSKQLASGSEQAHHGSEKHLGDGLPPADSSAGMSRKGSSKDILESGEISKTPSSQKFNEHFAKKIPAGAEASNILVGEVDFLEAPIIAFMRLSKACMLGDLTEVPVPTRFIFILLGPEGNNASYHEIGRSIATLMSDEVFHDVAYKAKGREDLLSGIDEFLDQVTVLPPGEWDPTIRIEPPKSVPSQEGRLKSGKHDMPNGGPPMEGGDGADGGEGGGGNGGGGEPEGHGSDASLMRTGRLFGGLIQDIKRKAPWYLSDWKDGIHIQALASFFFMYFACLTPIITFGGLLGSATDNNIAAMESLVSGAICGITYHLFSGQPLTIIGSTGPVLVFETIVFNFSHDYGLDYLGLRFWIGIWMAVILLIIVAFDLSALVRYITRFTEESFALLIALIFIVEAFKKLFHILDHYGVNLHPDVELDHTCYCVEKNATETNSTMSPSTVSPIFTTGSSLDNTTLFNMNHSTKAQCESIDYLAVGAGCEAPHYVADVFFLSCLLFMGTFILSMGLKMFRNTRFLPSKIRVLISDFSVFTAILLMVLADFGIGLDTPKLEVPAKFRPTRDDRGWVVNPFKNPAWCIGAGLPPALLATILIFMDQQITAVIVNRKENKLYKGCGYHLDLFLIAIQIIVCSILGTPWFVAATVLSINHVRSLTKESETSAPGERPKFLGIREQRLTGTVVFIMVGLSALMASVLKFIPMAVLYGVFLFMGISSVKGLQLIQRIFIVFMPPKYQPDYVFLRKVPLRRVHIFTGIQVLCLATLWVIKTIKIISIVFPLMVLAMCFVRKALDWVFTRHELKWLDDIMPESHKREKEDKKKKKEEQEEEKNQLIEMTGGAVNIPLKDGKSINIPVDRITYDPETNKVNISDEMAKTAIWKQLAANESHPNFEIYNTKREKEEAAAKANDAEDTGKREPVKFSIAEEEEADALMYPPEIVVDPPSKTNSLTEVNKL